MRSYETTVVSTGHGFLECPRWHEDRLWVSDHITNEVSAISQDGTVETIGLVENTPSGLGFSDTQGVLVVSMADRKLLRMDKGGGTSVFSDFSAVSSGRANDMQLHPAGFAWIGTYVTPDGGPTEPSRLVVVSPDGSAKETGGDVMFPNGMALAPGGVLLVAETFGHRITAFDYDESTGELANQRTWAQLPEGIRPDGIAYDSDGGVWYAHVMTRGAESGVYRVTEGGTITDFIPTPGVWAVAPGFGGPDLDELYICVCDTSFPEIARHEGRGSLIKTRVGRTGSFE